MQVRNGLAYFSTRALVEDSDGDIWIGTDHGLSHLHAGAFVHDAATAALGGGKSMVDPRGQRRSAVVWHAQSMASSATQRAEITAYTTAQGLANNSIYQLLADRRGSLWLSGPTTISSFPLPAQEPDAADTRLKVNVYELPYDTIPAQMYGGRQPSGCVGRDGAIWFASSRGAVRVLPQPQARVAPPRALLTGINADGRELTLSSPLVFPASLSRLEIILCAFAAALPGGRALPLPAGGFRPGLDLRRNQPRCQLHQSSRGQVSIPRGRF